MLYPCPSKFEVARRQGFTLIELLSVIAIIVVLFAILFPVISSVREQANSAKCVANLRSMNAVFAAYASDHRGYYPAARKSEDGDPAYGEVNEVGHWEAELAPYVGYNIRIALGDDGLTQLGICPLGQVGMNANMANQQRTTPTGEKLGNVDYKTLALSIQDPANTVMLGDSDHYHHDVWAKMTPDADGKYKSGDPVRHGDKANYLFVDGHVQSLNLDEVISVIKRGR